MTKITLEDYIVERFLTRFRPEHEGIVEAFRKIADSGEAKQGDLIAATYYI